jgi:hypothetical protein
MKTSIKKSFVLPVLVAVVAVLVACPSQAQFTYTTNNGTVTITGYTSTNANVVIPSTIDGLPVTSIGNAAFLEYFGLTSVTIPNSVTNIGNGAFAGCSSLTNVTIGNGVTSIGDDAFSTCYNLTSVTIPNSVTSIGNFAFGGSSSLTNVTIGNGVTSIGNDAFLWCSSLTAITVDPANQNCSSIGGVLFDKGQTTLIQYPEGKVGSYSIPNNVTSIGTNAFYSCTSLTSVTIPDSVTSIGFGPFSSCSSLTAIMVDSANRNYSSIGGVLFDKGQTTLIQYPEGKVGSYSIPNNVTSIGDGAFEGCTGLTSVTIPNSVTSIGNIAFDGCSSLTNVTIGNGVTSIGYSAFSNCTRLTSVTIPNSVTNIGNGAFAGCSSLTNVTIGNGVTSMGDDAFSTCYNLTSVTIPNRVTNIGDNAFAGCTSLTNVYFQGNAPTFGLSVFVNDPATAYYLPGTTGWGATAMRTALWTLPYPLILTSCSGFGIQTNQFGFTVSWATNLSVLVEASTDLAKSTWTPVATNALHGGTFYFSDPQWKNYPCRFYRVTGFSGLLPPQLVITSSGSTLVLTWPSNFSGFTLQSTTNLGSSANWTANLSPPVIVSGQHTVTNPISGTQQFFRLAH